MRRLLKTSLLSLAFCATTVLAQSANLEDTGNPNLTSPQDTFTVPLIVNQNKTDISGTWSFQVESPAGAGSPTFTFKQDGEKLTGQYQGAFGEAPLTGSVKDNKVDFVIKVEAQGQQMTITYTGTVEKDGSMKGTAELGDVGSATWTAKRK